MQVQHLIFLMLGLFPPVYCKSLMHGSLLFFAHCSQHMLSAVVSSWGRVCKWRRDYCLCLLICNISSISLIRALICFFFLLLVEALTKYKCKALLTLINSARGSNPIDWNREWKAIYLEEIAYKPFNMNIYHWLLPKLKFGSRSSDSDGRSTQLRRRTNARSEAAKRARTRAKSMK